MGDTAAAPHCDPHHGKCSASEGKFCFPYGALLVFLAALIVPVLAGLHGPRCLALLLPGGVGVGAGGESRLS